MFRINNIKSTEHKNNFFSINIDSTMPILQFKRVITTGSLCEQGLYSTYNSLRFIVIDVLLSRASFMYPVASAV